MANGRPWLELRLWLELWLSAARRWRCSAIWSWGRALVGAAAMPHMFLHGCELLFLLIRENRFNLAACFLRYRPGLGASVVLRTGLISTKRFELLLAIDK